MSEPNIILVNANTLELHYWFSDNSHAMDANVHNKCEFELLAIIKEIASIYNLEIHTETEPLAEGGLRRWFKIISKSEKKSAAISAAVIVAIIVAITVTPLSTTIQKLTEKLLDKVFEDSNLKNLQDEKLKLEIDNLRLDSALKVQQLDQSLLIKKRRSNFYDTLEKYKKVTQISVTIEDENKRQISEEQFVPRNNFKEYILVKDELEPQTIDNINIEIISPVLKKGKYKWRGIYNGMPISFDMKSKEFQELVQSGKIEFKNGSSINCVLEIERKISNEGVVEEANYSILRVNSYFENDTPIETNEGRQQRQRKQADEAQMKLFGGQK